MEFKLFLYIIIIFSAVFHEFMHGWMANQLGDSTARNLGRLTLNPLKHVELFGTILIPLFLLFTVGGFIGWAKPVPYNPYNLRGRYGSAKVGFAGPAANLILALLFGLFLRFIPETGIFFIALTWIIYINLFLALFNLIPIPPLDGSKLLTDFFPRLTYNMAGFSYLGIFFALLIAINLLPSLAGVLYFLITGQSFLSIAF